MTNRKLATIKRIDEIRAIPDADKICAYVVGGWTVVDTVGKYSVNDLAVFVEIDAWIPTELAPFLSKGKEPREFDGVKGERLRTVKLRKQLSQGLLLPLEPTCSMIESQLFEGLDVSEPLNIRKWEMPVNAQLAGMAKGNFPSLVPKTDQERVQNLKKEIKAAEGMLTECTEKLDGSSMTCYLIDGVFGVCSRNLDLKEEGGTTFWEVARSEGIEEKMRDCGPGDWAIQGELIGPGIQGNAYKLTKPEFYVFDVYNIQTGQYLNPRERVALIQRMGLKHVPVINPTYPLTSSIEGLLEAAEGESMLYKTKREGLVFKQVDGGFTFKAISNSWLLKNE